MRHICSIACSESGSAAHTRPSAYLLVIAGDRAPARAARGHRRALPAPSLLGPQPILPRTLPVCACERVRVCVCWGGVSVYLFCLSIYLSLYLTTGVYQTHICSEIGPPHSRQKTKQKRQKRTWSRHWVQPPGAAPQSKANAPSITCIRHTLRETRLERHA